MSFDPVPPPRFPSLSERAASNRCRSTGSGRAMDAGASGDAPRGKHSSCAPMQTAYQLAERNHWVSLQKCRVTRGAASLRLDAGELTVDPGQLGPVADRLVHLVGALEV